MWVTYRWITNQAYFINIWIYVVQDSNHGTTIHGHHYLSCFLSLYSLFFPSLKDSSKPRIEFILQRLLPFISRCDYANLIALEMFCFSSSSFPPSFHHSAFAFRSFASFFLSVCLSHCSFHNKWLVECACPRNMFTCKQGANEDPMSEWKNESVSERMEPWKEKRKLQMRPFLVTRMKMKKKELMKWGEQRKKIKNSKHENIVID